MLYYKCKAHEALLRTGCCGPKVVIGGGMFVLPYFQQVTRVDLSAKRIAVELFGNQAARTRDGVLASLQGSFYVRVHCTHRDIEIATLLLGQERLADPAKLTKLLAPKYAGIIRTVTSKCLFAEIEQDPESFKEKVILEVGVDFQALMLDDFVVEYFGKA